MTTIEKSIEIKAPPEKVYAFIDDAMHFPEFWPSLIEVKDVELLPAGGHRFHYLYKMAGARFEGVTETIEHKLNEVLVDRAKGQIEGTFSWKIMPVNGFTKLMLAVNYDLPPEVLKKLDEPVLVEQNELEAEFILKTLKLRLER